ncbi:MAG: YbaK/prolyl-tRNA synthetase associated domain-containing protein [Proteobacteria bacterium]|nr:YbaK/prolyl-tRNA synthetase associated domain-containing protein [Pseudomonadota bacterium]MBI3496073.1 YbaK/prolyl-tRNA synthetase associated domain-containing protein [Pseudomonadota bacterium]
MAEARAGEAETGVFERIVALLDSGRALYRVIEHPPEGRSEHISRIRGNLPSQAAKAMVVAVKTREGRRFALAILPGNRRVDFGAIARQFGGTKASFAAPEEARRLTGCDMGAVPPFSFSAELPVLVDPKLLEHNEIAFNAGRLDRSMFLATRSYLEIVKPAVAEIALPETTEAKT